MASSSQIASSNDLDCPKCRRVMVTPRILKCTHMFCDTCVQTMHNQDGFTCADCSDVSQGGEVLNVPAINKIFEKSKTRCKYFSRPQMYYTTTVTLVWAPFNIAVCDVCSKESENLSRCIDCRQILCNTCRLVHDRLTILRAHRWEDYEATADQPVSEAVFCTVHADAVAEYYCTDCSAMTCLHCIVASHQSHKLERISKSVENYSHLLQTFDNKLAASVDSLTKIVKQKGLYAKKADRLFEDAEENLKDQRREVDAKLDKEENTKLKRISILTEKGSSQAAGLLLSRRQLRLVAKEATYSCHSWSRKERRMAPNFMRSTRSFRP